jgi:3D-(3,5/4)-trihydroxycyclohexane-1,2-dione acylhydrolase (decyclizing)
VGAWHAEVDRLCTRDGTAPLPQSLVIGAVNAAAAPRDVVVAAAGSVPGDLHKLWRAREPNTYHLEYGYSCMGYEIAGGLGVKMADPSREVFVMVGDGSYLMMAQEIVTSIQEGYRLNIVLLDSQGFASIGGLSRAVGSGGFGTHYRYRNPDTGGLDGPPLPVDLAANAESLGAIVHRVTDRASLESALAAARSADRTSVIHVPIDPLAGVPGYDSWWDVAVAEVSEQDGVKSARKAWETGRVRQRYFL